MCTDELLTNTDELLTNMVFVAGTACVPTNYLPTLMNYLVPTQSVAGTACVQMNYLPTLINYLTTWCIVAGNACVPCTGTQVDGRSKVYLETESGVRD